MKQIKLRLVGGLGNQLYQFGYALLLLEKFDYKKIVIDYSDMNKYRENWGYMLPIVLDSAKVSHLIDFDQSWALKFRLPKLANMVGIYGFGFVSDKNCVQILEESNNSNLYLDGYFSHDQFLHRSIATLKRYIRDDLILDLPDNVLVVNVRGGEYARLGWTSLDDAILYENLINKAMKNIKNPVVHLVTDDIEYAKSLLSGICDIHVIHETSPIDNFLVLLSARHKILSKSTFAKWAGYLSSDNDLIYDID